ncbi:MAG TPA: NfeD family protein [Tepidisphaeraceae bacterium]|nr:NfeD family protein [Tepidisphaeraceae bacterium]
MPLPELAILLFGIGVALLLAELLLPAHGIIGVLGGLVIAAGIIVCYVIGFWLGTGVLLGLAILSPFIGAATVRIWPRTPIGRRVVLPPVVDPLPPPRVRIGQTGVAVSELRPMGTCEFGDSRLEAISEYGMIEPGREVAVVALTNNRPIVRAM